MNLNITTDSSITDEDVESVCAGSRKIFEWFCYTVNCSGYIPHIYEVDPITIRFVLRKIKGSKIFLRRDMQNKMVATANYMFRANQKYWPLRRIEDYHVGATLVYFEIRVEGELLSIHDPIALRPASPSDVPSRTDGRCPQSSGIPSDQQQRLESSEPTHHEYLPLPEECADFL
jgi:hypothetical protein